MESSMKANYRNTNVKFNMDDPIQAEAWNYLQNHKGTDSYARIIAKAISEAGRTSEKISVTNECGVVKISESDVFKIADEVVHRLMEKGTVITADEKNDTSEKNASSEIATNKSFEDKPDITEEKGESEYNTAYLTQDLLDFASG